MLAESKQTFSAGLEQHFLVLPDKKTVVGCDGADRKRLMMEDTRTNQVVNIGTHSNSVKSVLYFEKTKSLLVGDSDGHIVQYQRVGDSAPFERVKDFGDVGIGYVQSSTQVGDYSIFGGFDSSSLVVVNVSAGEVLKGRVKTAFKHVDSLRVCAVSDQKVLLSVGGRQACYVGNGSDVFEVIVDSQGESVETLDQLNISRQSDSLGFSLPDQDSMTCKMIEHLVSKIAAFIEDIFSQYASVFEKRPSPDKGTKYTVVLTQATASNSTSNSDLTNKLKTILEEFQFENLCKQI